jgi:hypothetical protein
MSKARDCIVMYQNQSLRYATHHATNTMGIVASKAHHSGRTKSAIKPSTMNTSQKIFFSILIILTLS